VAVVRASWIVAAALCVASTPTSAQARDSVSTSPVDLSACVEVRRAPVDSVRWATPDPMVVARAMARYAALSGEPPRDPADAVTFLRAGREWLFVSLGTHLGSPYGAYGTLISCSGAVLAFEYDVAADSVTRPESGPPK
jgi:hypothetical protein